MLYSSPSRYSGPLWADRTVGLLGGSFNPAHEGHRHISLQAIKHLGLDAVWWMVSPQNPLKPLTGMASFSSRLASAQVIARHQRIVVTDIEGQLGSRHTAPTLKKLKALYPRTQFIWLMGADNLHQIHRWEKWRDIFKAVPVCVIDRSMACGRLKSCPASGVFSAALLDQSAAITLKYRQTPVWTILHTPLNDLSSTSIRAQKRK
jgi:nicotinate-nucleotide adenylyltransferase